MIHDGHRERLRNKFIANPDLLTTHELFELLLYNSISRMNTNVHAHELVERFSSVKGVLDAGFDELTEINGIGKSSAFLIKLVAEITHRYKLEETENKINLLKSHEVLRNYLSSLFIGQNIETSYILLFDRSKYLIETVCLSKGNESGTIIPMKKLAQIVISSPTSYVILVHNHPHGKAIPSGNDIHITTTVKNFLKPLEIELIDHFIITANQCTPIINVDKTHLYNDTDK